MKAISIGNRYEIHEDSLKSYDKLPVNTYTVRFDKMTGFYLMLRPDLAVKEKVSIRRKRTKCFTHSPCSTGTWASS